MKKTTNRLLAIVMTLAMLVTFTASAFAAQSTKAFAQTAQSVALTWLDKELAELDTDFSDNRIDWIAFVFARCGYKSNFDYFIKFFGGFDC